jgi:nucleotide-binding universal stress UspA family protein
MPGIVVGVDGSPNSERALAWAMQEAAIRSAPLTVLAVHPAPKSYWGNVPVVGPGDVPQLEVLRRAVEETTQRASGPLGEARPASISTRAVNGVPVQELLAASHDADMLVVGSRGGGGLRPVADGLGQQPGRAARDMPGGGRAAAPVITAQP